jgi:uridine kinase
MNRLALLDELAARIANLPHTHPLRVAVDGVDASGKTTLADELAHALTAYGRPVIRASIDGFHRPRADRYRHGADSPDSYYLDAFDYPAVRTALLLPLGPGGTRRYRRAIFDYRRDTPLASDEELAPADAILVMDGVFLLRPELSDCWDYRIFVDAPFEVTLARAVQRDVALFGSPAAVEARYQQRYIPAQRRYLQEVHPRERANAVVLNTEPSNSEMFIQHVHLP